MPCDRSPKVWVQLRKEMTEYPARVGLSTGGVYSGNAETGQAEEKLCASCYVGREFSADSSSPCSADPSLRRLRRNTPALPRIIPDRTAVPAPLTELSRYLVPAINTKTRGRPKTNPPIYSRRPSLCALHLRSLAVSQPDDSSFTPGYHTATWTKEVY